MFHPTISYRGENMMVNTMRNCTYYEVGDSSNNTSIIHPNSNLGVTTPIESCSNNKTMIESGTTNCNIPPLMLCSSSKAEPKAVAACKTHK